MAHKQRTIKSDVSLSGIGLHTGCEVEMTLKPADENAGIHFVRVDLPDKPLIKADPSNINTEDALQRCTSIGQGDATVHTVEHLMSVLCGLRISNLTVEINAKEVPGLDGSGLEFLKAIKEVGVLEQDQETDVFKVIEPVGVQSNGSSIYIVPADDFKVSYMLHYNHPYLQSQFFDVVVDEQTYQDDIVSSRTFCLEQEATELQKRGLGLGADHTNTLVVGEHGVVDNELRFSDECARHKVLDFIGDLYLLGVPIQGHVFAVKSGHDLNIQLLKKLSEQKKRFDQTSVLSSFDSAGQKEIGIDDIMKILPHRYPFLLVDRVIEIEEGKRGIGIKNVTINDNFFQGHFPSRPVMPGVMMVEAMAQTGGVVVLTNKSHRGKLAFFLSADNVKFRKVVSPGDQLLMEVDVVKDKSRIAQVRAVARVNDDIVAEADMVFSFTDVSYLDH